jgi:hypothetical protein
MTTLLHQPNLTEGLTLLGWRLKRDAEIRGEDLIKLFFKNLFFFSIFKNVKMKQILNVKSNQHQHLMLHLNICQQQMMIMIHMLV